MIIDSLQDLKAATHHLINTASRSICIFSSSLDKRILSNSEIESAIIRLIRENRNAKIQCLIFDEQELQAKDHRLVNIAQRFTSFIEIRVIPEESRGTISGYYIADKKEMLYRRNRDAHQAKLYKLPQQEVKDKTKQFEDIWQQSRPASFLRALHL